MLPRASPLGDGPRPLAVGSSTLNSNNSTNNNNIHNKIHKRNYPFKETSGGDDDEDHQSSKGKSYGDRGGGGGGGGGVGGGLDLWEEDLNDALMDTTKSSKIAKICQISFRPLVQKIFPDSEIVKLRVRHGAMPGQNFTSIIYAVEAHLRSRRHSNHLIQSENNSESITSEDRNQIRGGDQSPGQRQQGDGGDDVDEVLHLVMKCFPNHPARQDFFRKIDIFRKELDVYRYVLPELMKFQRERFAETDAGDQTRNKQKMLNAFPIFYGGDYGNDYDRYWENCYGSLIAHGNFILLEDIRRTEGYSMHSKYEGLPLPHCKLVLSTLAQLHALSMAYIKVALDNKSSLSDTFPSLRETIVTPQTEETASALFNASFSTSIEIVATETGTGSVYSQKMRRFGNRVHWIFGHILAGNGDSMSLEQMLQVKPDFSDLHDQNKERKRNSWFVLTHGDCYLNNILFKYDEKDTQQQHPISVKLVDLQIVRENCLTIDLVNFIYLSTTQSFRKDNLNKLLLHYYEAFLEACQELGVEPPADFNMPNLTMKFQRAKIWGMINSLFVLPVALADAGGVGGGRGGVSEGVGGGGQGGRGMVDVDDMNEHLTACQMFDKLLKQGVKCNEKLYERVVQLVKEMVEDGVI